MNDSVILLSVDGPIATLTLNRPEAGNTVNLDFIYTLLKHAIRCDQDPDIRCVVLTGAGKLFCGGGDIHAFKEMADNGPAYLSELAGVMHMGISRLMRMKKPLITLVNGPAAGAGLSLAIMGDVVLASTSANFTAAYGGVGLTPDGGMSWLLPRLVGLRRAQDMIICNRRVDAAEAAEIGLVTRVVDHENLASEGRATATALAQGATRTMAGARALLLSSFDSELEAQLDREVRSISAAAGEAEFREGVRAFLERRQPDFSGAR